VGSFVNRFGSFISVFLVLYLVDRGFSAADAGLAAASYGAGSFAAAIIGGFLADRLGRKNAMALSMFSAAGAALALSQVEGLPAIIALSALFGLTSDLYRPASAALLTDLVPSERRLPAFAGYRLAINAGFAFGPAVAGFLAERSFLWLFVGEAITSTVLGIVALVALPEGVRTRRGEERRGEGFRTISGDRTVVLFFVAIALSAFVYLQSGSTLPLHVRAAGLSTSFYGFLISINGALIVLIELPVISVLRRFVAPRVIAAGIAVTGVGFGLLAFGADPVLLVASAVTWTVGEIAAAPMGNAYVADLAPRRLRGRYQGAYGLTFSIGLVLAPAIGTRLFAWSPAGLWLICAALSVVAAALILPLPARRVEPDLTPSPTAPERPGLEA
ncbi:MAG: MFS transporter, partial [Actinomycetota bacterium]